MQKNFSHPVSVDDIFGAQKEYKLTANALQRREIAEIFKVPEVKEFAADIYAERKKKSTIIDVWGYVHALITRQSVISLEYFDKEYDSEFVLQFDTNITEAQIREMEENGEDSIPDSVQNGIIDMAHLAMEQIALELEDHPRQDGEVFSFSSEFTSTEHENPFKILEKLKK